MQANTPIHAGWTDQLFKIEHSFTNLCDEPLPTPLLSSKNDTSCKYTPGSSSYRYPAAYLYWADKQCGGGLQNHF